MPGSSGTGCFQQIVSLVAATLGRSRRPVDEFLEAAYGVPKFIWGALIGCLLIEALLEEKGDSLSLGSGGQRMLGNRSIHLTFAGSADTSIVDQVSDRRSGQADILRSRQVRLGEKGWRITGIDPITGAALSVGLDDGVAAFASPARSTFEQVAVKFSAPMGGHFRT